MAPEIFAGRGAGGPASYDGPAADVWSLGVCLFILVFQVPPFERPSVDDARFVRVAMEENVGSLLHEWGVGHLATLELVDILRCIFVLDPARRPTVTQLLQHPYMQLANAEVAGLGGGGDDDAMEAD